MFLQVLQLLFDLSVSGEGPAHLQDPVHVVRPDDILGDQAGQAPGVALVVPYLNVPERDVADPDKGDGHDQDPEDQRYQELPQGSPFLHDRHPLVVSGNILRLFRSSARVFLPGSVSGPHRLGPIRISAGGPTACFSSFHARCRHRPPCRTRARRGYPPPSAGRSGPSPSGRSQRPSRR